jgi:hypothetical protein
LVMIDSLSSLLHTFILGIRISYIG